MKARALQNKIQGPIFSIITPFKKNEKIDYKKLRAYIKYLYNGGGRSFYLMPYNSRFTLLDEKEILNLNYLSSHLIPLEKVWYQFLILSFLIQLEIQIN